MGAAIDALRFLNNKKKDGTPDYKYEAAAFCLGAMSHYIGDVVILAHVYPASSRDYNTYESYILKYTGYDREQTFGGPQKDWNVDDFMIEKQLSLKPMLPYYAAYKQAEYTALGMDYYGDKSVYEIDETEREDSVYFYKGLYKGNPNYNADCANRIKELTCWSVYHTACAILWVLNLANMNNRTDTTSDRMAQTEGELYGSVPNTKEQILQWALGELDEDTISQWADTIGIDPEALTMFMNTMVLFAPMLIAAIALISIPIVKEL